jgi:hypothetical protein
MAEMTTSPARFGGALFFFDSFLAVNRAMWRAGDSRRKSVRQASFSPRKWAVACSQLTQCLKCSLHE